MTLYTEVMPTEFGCVQVVAELFDDDVLITTLEDTATYPGPVDAVRIPRAVVRRMLAALMDWEA